MQTQAFYDNQQIIKKINIHDKSSPHILTNNFFSTLKVRRAIKVTIVQCNTLNSIKHNLQETYFYIDIYLKAHNMTTGYTKRIISNGNLGQFFAQEMDRAS